MATTQVTLPAARDTRQTFIREISTILAGGNDVQFVNGVGSNDFVRCISVDTDGTVAYRTMDSNVKISRKLMAGGWHIDNISFIYASGTDASLNINVKAEL